MQTRTSLLLIITAFALGFATSEYRQAHLSPVSSHTNPEQFNPADKDQKTATQTLAPNSLGSQMPISVPKDVPLSENKVEPFSWARIEQLVASGQHDEAILLLQSQMGDSKNAVRAWLALALIYKKQSHAIAAVDAWFRYVKLELDDQKINKALGDIKNYLLQLKESPALFNEDYAWLMGQFDELLKYNPNDGQLHLVLASVLLQLDDTYQAQYHALMAANDPKLQKNAEDILAKLSGKTATEELTIPLVRTRNQFVVSATIEGNPARLLLDTGASLSGLSSTYTEKYPSLLKALKPIRLNTAGGVRDTYLFTVTNMTLGNLAFNQHILAQLPMDNSAYFDGLLGIDILGRFDFVIDQNAGLLRLKPRNSL